MPSPIVERANIKSSLYLMDVVSYIAQSMGDLGDESECSTKGAKCKKIWKGKDPGQNIPTYLNPKLLKELPAIFTDLPADPTQDNVDSVVLSNPNSNADLKVALAKISASSLSKKKKARVKAALYLMDVIGYIAQAMGDLDGEAECANPDAACAAIWMGADPYANVSGKIKPSKNALKKLFALARNQDPKNYQQVLEDQYLIDPNSNFDLRLALCSMDPETNYCPVLGGAKPAEIPKGKKTEVTIPVQNIAYLPGTPKITIMLSEDVEDGKITYDTDSVAKDGDNVVVILNVPADAKLGERTVLIASEDGRIEVTKAGAFEVVEPPDTTPPVVSVAPDHAAPGDTVTLTITSKNLDMSEADEVQSGAFNILTIARNDGKKILLKPAKVNEDAAVQKYTLEIQDPSGAVIATAPFAIKPGEWTTMEKAAYLVQKQLGAEFNVSIGYSGFTGDNKLADAPRTDQAAFENRPHFTLGFGFVPHIVGSPDSDAFVKSKAWDLKANGHFDLGTMFGTSTQMLGAGLGTNVKLTILPEFQPEIYGQYEFDKSNFHNPSVWALYGPQVHQGSLVTRDPSEMLYEGHSHALTGGLAFNSEFKTGKLPWKLRLYGESYQDMFTWTGDTQVSKFDGQDQAVRLGFLGTLGFSVLSKGAPDFTLHVSGIPWGTHEEPVWAPGADSSMFHGLTGIGAEGKLAWNGVEGWQPHLLGGYSQVTMDNWDHGKMSEWHVGAGSTLPFMYTKLDAIVGGRNNITPLGEDSPFFMVLTGSPATSRDFLGGRLNAFSLSLTYDQFSDSQGTGYNSLGAFLGVDMVKLILGEPPKGKPIVKVDEEPAKKPAKKPEPAKPAVDASSKVKTEDNTLEAISDIEF